MCETRQERPPPADPGCAQQLTPELLREIVDDADVVRQYERLVEMKSNDKYREVKK